MPTLTTRKTANIATTMAAQINTIVNTATTTAAVVSGDGSNTATTNSNAPTTCTFSSSNDYQQQQQHQQQQLPSQYNHHYHTHQMLQQQQQQQHQQHHYQPHENSPPPLPPPHLHLDEIGTGSSSGNVTFNGNCSVSSSGAAAAAAAVTLVASNTTVPPVTTLNVSNNNNNSNNSGNIAKITGVTTHSNGNGNIMNATALTTTKATITAASAPTAGAAATTATTANINQVNQLESSYNSIGGIGGGGGGSSSLNGSIKKSSTSSYASREDVASLGGGSSVNSQSIITTHNNISSTGSNNNNNNNSITKGSKDNLLQNYYNGISGIGSGTVSSRNTDNDDDDGLGPLPPKWETAYTERGELYFIDHNTGTSHWLDPRLSKFQKKSLEDCSDDELPYGWEKIEDSLYGTYYIDHVNRRTQYENPVLEAKRRAAEQRKQQNKPDGERGEAALNINEIQQQQQRGPPPPPVVIGTGNMEKPTFLPYKFTRNPQEMLGERITTTVLKSARGLGITIVGGDDNVEEFLQIKSIVPNGPAWLDGQLQTGDVLVYVNDTCVLGFTHHEMVNVFQSIMPGETVSLEVCRGYPLPFDPNDPNTEVVTTIAVEPEKQRILMDLNMDGNYNFLDISGGASGTGDATTSTSHDSSHKNKPHASETPGDFILMKKPEVLTFSIVKGVMGFGFTIADSAYGQKVKKILDRNCCKNLQEGDILLEINNVSVCNKSHIEVVQVLKDCSKIEPTTVKIQRGSTNFNAANLGSGNVSKLRKNFIGNGLFRSKTPTADLYSTQQKEILPIRPKTPLVDTRRARVQTPNNELNDEVAAATNGIVSQAHLERSLAESKSQVDGKSTNSLQEIDAINHDIPPFMDPYPKLVTSLSERLAEAKLLNDTLNSQGTHGDAGAGYHVNSVSHSNYDNPEYMPSSSNHNIGAVGGGYNPIYGMSPMPVPHTINPLNPSSHQHQSQHHFSTSKPPTNNTTIYTPAINMMSPVPTYHHDSCYCYECQDYQRYKFRHQQQQQQHQANFYTLQSQQPSPLLPPPLNHQHHQQQHQSHYSPALHPATTSLQAAHIQNERMQKRVNELLNDRRKVGFSPLESHNAMNASSYPISLSQQHSPAAASSISEQLQQTSSWNYNMAVQPTMGGGGGAAAQVSCLVNGGMHVAGGVTPSIRQQRIDEDEQQFELTEVTLERQALGFGFRIVGGTEEGSQVTVGHIVPGGAADNDHRIATGDEILSIDGINVVNSSHHKVVSLMGEAALRGQVTMILRRRIRHLLPMAAALRPALRYPYDVIVSRHENEGFGFVIISSSNQYYGSTIGKLISGSPADRCGELKVGDRIIAVNRIEIAGMSHGDVVQLIKESGLHVRLTIGCPKESGNSILNSAQASPGQLSSQTHQSASSATSAATTLPSTASLLQTNNKNDIPTYFERTAQMTQQHPQL